MRILFLHHLPLVVSEPGRLVERWAQALLAGGHEVRALVVDDGRQAAEPFPVDRVTCSASDSTAELHFPLPRFDVADGATEGVAFSQLSDGQLSEYRENLRRRLDGQIDRFNPHVLHGQHLWLQGQLALETGVPYVLNAWHDELAGPAADARFQDLVAQAAENASRILVPDEAVRARVAAAFDGAVDRTMIMPRELHAGALDASVASGEISARLVALYQAVLEERFGQAS